MRNIIINAFNMIVKIKVMMFQHSDYSAQVDQSFRLC